MRKSPKKSKGSMGRLSQYIDYLNIDPKDLDQDYIETLTSRFLIKQNRFVENIDIDYERAERHIKKNRLYLSTIN